MHVHMERVKAKERLEFVRQGRAASLEGVGAVRFANEDSIDTRFVAKYIRLLQAS